MSLAADKKLWLKANKAYHSGAGQSIMTDAEFDALEARIRKVDPEWGPLHQTGVIDAKKEDVALPNYMPSLDKHYPEEIEAWVEKKVKRLGADASAVISDKLDGSSIQIGYRKGVRHFMATRGDGETGGDISFLLPFMSIPKTIPVDADVYLRCEAVMQEKVFHAKYSVDALGEKAGYKTARAAVAGILNRTGAKINAPMLADIDIVVLGIYGESIVDGFMKAAKWGFKTPGHSETSISNLTPTWLDRRLTSSLKHSVYAMDGLVIAINRRFEYAENERPKWATAYKRNVTVEDAPQSTIRRIQWDISHAGKWTPTAQFDPVMMDGVEVTQASLYSAEWMRDRKLGPGAVVKVIRSGEVIPKVIDVVKPADEMQWPPGEYEWRGAYLYSTKETARQRCERIYRFLEILGVEDIAIKTVITLHDGGVNRIHKLLRLLESEKLVVQTFTKLGIGPAKAKKLYAQREKMLNATLKSYVLASSCFEGVAESRLDALEAGGISLSTLLNSTEGKRPDLTKIHGFKGKTQAAVFKGVDRWQIFWPTIQDIVSPAEEKAVTGKWSGKTAVWTGYRSAEQEAEFTAHGGKVASSVTRSTSYLFCKPGGKSGSKLDKAKSLGVAVLHWDEFVKS